VALKAKVITCYSQQNGNPQEKEQEEHCRISTELLLLFDMTNNKDSAEKHAI